MNALLFKPDYYRAISDSLKTARDGRSLSIEQVCRKTRLSRDCILKMESGDFDFTTQVYIKGYLRTLANFTGLDGRAMVREYEQIRHKVHFVSQDMYAVSATTVLPEGDSLPPSDPVRDADPTEILTLDEKVVRKIRKEKRMNRIITWTSAGLVSLCLIFILFDDQKVASEITGQNTPAAVSDTRASLTAAKLRKKWQLSDPILSEKETSLKEAYLQKVTMDSMNRARFQKNQYAGKDRPVRPISVQEAALELETKLSESTVDKRR